MATQEARGFCEEDLNLNNTSESYNRPNCNGFRGRNPSITNILAQEVASVSEEEVSSSSYIMANDISQLSQDVDRWINGSMTSHPTESTAVQDSRQTVMQRSTVTSSCMGSDTMWYVIAMMLPMLSVHNCVMTLRCTPSHILNSAEILFNKISRICAKAKLQIQRIARDQGARDLFAAAMDVLLIIYALGFLVLSMYQASIIG